MEKGCVSANHALISEATEALRLRDIFLWQCHMSRPRPFPEDARESVEQMGRREVQLIRDEIPGTDGEALPIVQFYVGLGLRLVGPAGKEGEDDDAEPPIFLEIEAQYLVEYHITNPAVSEEALIAFAQFNAVHNVWPFWRQHIFDLRQRGGLPRIEVPLFSGVGP